MIPKFQEFVEEHEGVRAVCSCVCVCVCVCVEGETPFHTAFTPRTYTPHTPIIIIIMRKKAEPTVNTSSRLPLPAHLTNNPLKSEGMYILRRRLSGYDHVVFIVNKGHISLVSHSRTVHRSVGEQGAEKYIWTEQETSNNRAEKNA